MAVTKAKDGEKTPKKATMPKIKTGGSGASGVLLSKLQQVLFDCWSLETRVQEIPVQIEAKRNALNSKKKQLLVGIEQLKKVGDYIKDSKTKLDEVIKRREEAEEKLERVSTQREFDSENAIAESAKKEEHRIRVNMNTLERKKEAIQTKVKEMEDDIAEMEGRIEAELSDLEKELAETIEARDKALEKKKKASVKIDPNLLYKFERIIRNKGGLASVGLKSGICQGCHMQLPDEFVNIVRENKEIQFCPYCSRILVYEEGKEDEEIIESNIKYQDKRQSEEDERELNEAMSADELPEEDIDDIEEAADDDMNDDDDDLGELTKETLAENSLIADESEFEL